MATASPRRTEMAVARGHSSFNSSIFTQSLASRCVRRLPCGFRVSKRGTHLDATTRRNRPGGERFRKPPSGRNEQGATLILALVFLVVVGLVAGSLVQWAGGDLTATSQFTSAHSNESAANGANAIAVQFVRYNFLTSSLFASPPTPCWSSTGNSTFSLSSTGPTMDSWCSTNWRPLSQNSRVVTISTCPSTTSSTNCAATPYLQTTVTIDDVSKTTGITSCVPLSTAVSNTGRTCGQHLTLNSWAFGVSPPTITSVTNGSLNCGTSKSIVISGTGLDQTSQVYFIIGSSNPPATFVATSFSSVSSTTVNACTPSISVIPSGTAYVVAQTPTGSNWYGPGPPSSPTATWP